MVCCECGQGPDWHVHILTITDVRCVGVSEFIKACGCSLKNTHSEQVDRSCSASLVHLFTFLATNLAILSFCYFKFLLVSQERVE